jgi:hypothetical protein
MQYACIGRRLRLVNVARHPLVTAPCRQQGRSGPCQAATEPSRGARKSHPAQPPLPPTAQTLPSSHAVVAVHRKNCEPLVLGPGARGTRDVGVSRTRCGMHVRPGGQRVRAKTGSLHPVQPPKAVHLTQRPCTPLTGVGHGQDAGARVLELEVLCRVEGQGRAHRLYVDVHDEASLGLPKLSAAAGPTCPH